MYNTYAYKDYMDGVLNGSIIACDTIYLACKRAKQWEQRNDIYFDEEDVQKRIKLIYKLKHTTGGHYGKPFELLGWQQFAIAQMFGWKYKDTNRRVTRKAFIMISRKAGKTALAAAIAISTILCDGIHDNEIDLVANSRQQANIAFKHINNFIASIDPNNDLFQRYRSEIRLPVLESNIQVLSSDSMGLDGYSSGMCIMDEMHAQKNWDLYNVMMSSMGARENPLMCVITTAGFLVGETYPCYSMWTNCIDILKGTKQDDSQFSMIFQLDEDDEWTDETKWIKCAPSLGQTVSLDYMRNEIHSALNNSSLEVGVRTKLLNQWMQSSDVWLPHHLLVENSQSFELEDICKGSYSLCYVGIDLASISDLTSVTAMIEKDNKFYFKTWLYLPEQAIKESANSQLYKEAVQKGYLNVTEGNVTDYDFILNKLIEINKIVKIAEVAYDSFNATQFAISATENRLPLEPFSQSLGNFNRPTKEFERLLRSGRVVIDNNPMVIWCFDNCTLKFDHNENCKPVKGGSRNSKIDATISIIESLGAALNNPKMSVKLTAL